ncbi:MAG: hypothetical protein J2P27_06710 [Actinobacteria bacterium]|nr:hypothetical protein [Actinomycetota bacterium]
MAPTHVHLDGSVDLADADCVMREIAVRVPAGVRRIRTARRGIAVNRIFFRLDRFL